MFSSPCSAAFENATGFIDDRYFYFLRPLFFGNQEFAHVVILGAVSCYVWGEFCVYSSSRIVLLLCLVQLWDLADVVHYSGYLIFSIYVMLCLVVSSWAGLM